MSILERVEALCSKSQITLNRLEKDTGISQGTIRKWDSAYPSSRAISLVADYFNVSVDYLLGRTTNPNSHEAEPFASYSKIFKVLDSHNVNSEEVESLARILDEILTMNNK